MGELCILDRDAGDLTVEWDPARAAEVEEARATFDRLRAKGFLAHRVAEGGTPGRLLHAFDPQARRIILRPALRGGAAP